MPPSRRALLRASIAGALGSLAGCAGGDRTTTTWTTTGGRTTASARTPTTRATGKETPADTTGRANTDSGTTTDGLPAIDARSIEFAHRDPAFGWGVSDARTRYYAHVLETESDAATLDSSAVRDGIAGQRSETVEEFVAGTDFETTALIAVQAEVPSFAHGLAFDFVDWHAAPPQVVVHAEEYDRPAGDAATSTLLVRVPARVASQIRVTLVDRHAVFRSRPLHVTETFAPPNRPAFESVNVEDMTDDPSEALPVPGGALVTTPDAAERLAPTDAPFAEFVRGTGFDEAFVLAVQLRMGANGYHLWPTDVTTDGREIVAQFRRGFGGGLNAEFTNLALARIPGEAPERGVASVRRYDGRRNPVGTRSVRLSSDPEAWADSGPTTGTTNADGNRS